MELIDMYKELIEHNKDAKVCVGLIIRIQEGFNNLANRKDTVRLFFKKEYRLGLKFDRGRLTEYRKTDSHKLIDDIPEGIRLLLSLENINFITTQLRKVV